MKYLATAMFGASVPCLFASMSDPSGHWAFAALALWIVGGTMAMYVHNKANPTKP
jgi:hypothetical protein